MTLLLRQKVTGDIYVYTEALARREDMEPFDSPPPAPEKPATIPVDKGVKPPTKSGAS
jgi:hypothetical protein